MATAEASTQSTTHDPVEALETHFGHRDFLDGQKDVVSAILAGRDALAVMPTGGGKSLCYQLPAMVMDGVTIVVSPLIALMKDQVDALVEKGIAAAMINSTLSPDAQRDHIERMRDGEFKLVYIAPERFRSHSFTEALKQINIALFAIDEAHCLSQWGHDFRPDYLRLGDSIRAIGSPQTAAFTATATPEVRADIVQHLRLRDPFECVSGFARPNLSLKVSQCEKRDTKYKRIRAVIENHKTGIVYCATRKRVEEVSETMASWGCSVVAYHGGMSDADREAAQDQFISKKRDVAVATNAFGMGIDRSDVRFVIHFDVPGSVEAYYQEAGRAGRDGEPSVCELLFNYADTRTQEFFIEGSNPSFSLIRDLYQHLRNFSNERGEVVASVQSLSDDVGAKNGMAVSAAISQLSRCGGIERFDVPGERTRGTRLLRPDTPAEELGIDSEALAEKEQRDRDKLKSMVELCYSTDCRQSWILNYFGEAGAGNCNSCDNCQAGSSENLRGPDDAERGAVQKALSGVARMSRRTAGGDWEPRFGRMKIVSMLVGSRSKEMLDARLDSLSTYGIMKAEGSNYVAALMRELQTGGMLASSGGQYPTVTLSPKGETAMRGDSSYRMRWPSPPERAAAMRGAGRRDEEDIAIEGLEFDESLFDKLRDKRNEIAAEEGIPAYVVFNNQTLEFFTRLKPESVAAGSKIRGVGEKKAERFLPAFVEVIKTHCEG
jgi:ATP-dependent DNA helicase RecQ